MRIPLNRREFMETSSPAVGLTLASSRAERAFAAEGKPVRVGVVGVGSRGRGLPATMITKEG